MSAILKFEFQKKKTITFFQKKTIQTTHTHTKKSNFACDNDIFHKTEEIRTGSGPICDHLNRKRRKSRIMECHLKSLSPRTKLNLIVIFLEN